MPDFRVEHRFNCSEESFWSKVFFDADYNRRLFLEYLKFSGWRELKNEDKGDQVQRVVEAVPPIGDLPGPLKAVVGDNAGYEERGVFDRKTRRYQATVVPNRLADKISVKIAISTVADGPEHCKRIAEGSVSAKIFGVGGLLEKKMIADLEKSYEKSATFTNAFVAEKGIR
ncbi:MAG TPA: DUF2505 family protein [Polyangiaceae bacterium]|nr:DUF2505 family protein [Polyangiaceae bacterium]